MAGEELKTGYQRPTSFNSHDSGGLTAHKAAG